MFCSFHFWNLKYFVNLLQKNAALKLNNLHFYASAQIELNSDVKTASEILKVTINCAYDEQRNVARIQDYYLSVRMTFPLQPRS